MKQEQKPFTSSHSPNLPSILRALNCSVILSTYQAGKVVLVSATEDEKLVQLPRNFDKAMGIALSKDRLAIAMRDELVLFKNSEKLAKYYPKNPDTYDALYLPRATYFTGPVDIHDVHFGKQGAIWAVNTTFSCLCIIDQEYSFTPRWKPKFIKELIADDRCHLNGLAMHDGIPKYITALGIHDAPYAWKSDILNGGIIIDLDSDEIIARHLGMPHSPRIFDGQLFCLLSAKEKLIKVDVNTGKYEELAHIPGFLRGMAKCGDFLFIGTSQVRKSSSTFKKLGLDFADRAKYAGFVVLHLPTGKVVANYQWVSSVEEVYDIQIIPNKIRPNIANTFGNIHKRALMIPGKNYWFDEELFKKKMELQAKKSKSGPD